KLVATIRSREISACLVLQAKSQLKAIYKDNADTIIGNMDSQIFLGGTEKTTLKDLTEILGKETIDMYTTGNTKGSQESYNMNYQKLGKELMSMDELAVMDGSKCIVQVRGVRPFLSDKYDLTKHPNYPLTADYDKKNWFDIEKYLNRKLVLHPNDEYEVFEDGESK
ncbi:MAG: TraM recognition domain-containing protein, partial [Butyrivibrio sp.]|nr:TraM recognition domain-containing protein [Butyrivibrio sp.]